MPATDSSFAPITSAVLDVATPAVVVDLDVLERNITTTAQRFRELGVEIRPHAKTHKVAEIADRQLAAGAVGLTVATIGEAEAFSAAGVSDIFIAYPLWIDPRNAVRLRDLAGHCTVRIGVDSIPALEQIARELRGTGITVSLEIDSGHHRSGTLPEQAVPVFERAREVEVMVDGIFTFPGHSYTPGKTHDVAAQETQVLTDTAQELRSAGFTVNHVSGGSTPTAMSQAQVQTGSEAWSSPASAPHGAMTEIRPGVYVFFDAQQLELGTCAIQDVALTVAATVISRQDSPASGPRRIVVNAGSKVLGSDRPAWATGFGRLPAHPAARITALSEHHGTVVFPDDDPLPELGEQLRLIPNHVCLTTNLVDHIHVTRGDDLLEEWPVIARGRNA